MRSNAHIQKRGNLFIEGQPLSVSQYAASTTGCTVHISVLRHCPANYVPTTTTTTTPFEVRYSCITCSGHINLAAAGSSLLCHNRCLACN